MFVLLPTMVWYQSAIGACGHQRDTVYDLCPLSLPRWLCLLCLSRVKPTENLTRRGVYWRFISQSQKSLLLDQIVTGSYCTSSLQRSRAGTWIRVSRCCQVTTLTQTLSWYYYIRRNVNFTVARLWKEMRVAPLQLYWQSFLTQRLVISISFAQQIKSEVCVSA